MNSSLKKWFVIFLIVILGIVAKYISSYTYKTELILEEGQTVDISLFRLSSTNVGMSLAFKRGTKALGKYSLSNSTTHNQDGFVEHVDPGDPVILLINDKEHSTLYEAKPTGSGSKDGSERIMFPYEEDNNPNRFSYPMSKTPHFVANAGFSKFQIKVMKVGENLKGEKVILKISPPMSNFKFISMHPLYGPLWLINLWPLIFIFLFLSYKEIRKESANKEIIRSNIISIFDYITYYILLVPSVYAIVLFIITSYLFAFVVAFAINFIALPLFLKRKYPLNNYLQKISVWFIWIISSGTLFYISYDHIVTIF